jgi:internalin A
MGVGRRAANPEGSQAAPLRRGDVALPEVASEYASLVRGTMCRNRGRIPQQQDRVDDGPRARWARPGCEGAPRLFADLQGPGAGSLQGSEPDLSAAPGTPGRVVPRRASGQVVYCDLVVALRRIAAWLASAGLFAACGGKTGQDADSSTEGEPAGSAGSGGRVAGQGGAAPVDCSGVLSFADPALEAEVREAVHIPTGELRFDDVAQLQELEPAEAGILDLTGIQCLTGLTRLYLQRNAISDLRPLSALTALNRLSLSYNSVSDLSPLAGLTSLQRLNVTSNAVSDLSPLSSLTALTILSLANNSVSDLSPLAELTSLTELALPHNSVSDLSPLAGLTSVQRLYLADNAISDLSPLAGLTSLSNIDLADNLVTDLGPLVANTGFGEGDYVSVLRNPLDCAAQADQLHALIERGLQLASDCDE